MRRSSARNIGLCLLAFACCVLASLSALAAESDERRIDELMHKSGIWEQVAAVREQIKAGVHESATEEKKSGRSAAGLDIAKLETAVDHAFAADTLRTTVAAELGRLLSPADVDEVLVWLSSDLGSKLTRLEEQHTREQDVQKRQEQLAEAVRKLAPERIALCERLVDSLKMDRQNAETMLNLMSAIVYSVAAASGQGDPEEAARVVRKRFEAQLPQMQAHFHQLAVASMAQAYRDVSDADLERYVAFNETPAARRYNAATSKAFERALLKGCLELGRYLGQEVQRQPRVSSRKSRAFIG